MGSRHVRILKAKCCAQVSWFSVPICARVSRYAIRSSASSLVPCRVLAPQHSSSYSASSYQSDCTDGQAAVSRLKNHSLRPRNSLWTSYWRYHRRPHPKPESKASAISHCSRSTRSISRILGYSSRHTMAVLPRQQSICDNQCYHARENQQCREGFSDHWLPRLARSR